MHLVSKLLAALVAKCRSYDQEDSGDGDEECSEVEQASAVLVALAKFCAYERKSLILNDLICEESIMDARMESLEGRCGECGFKHL